MQAAGKERSIARRYPKGTRFLERYTPVTIGIGEVAVGLLLTVIAKLLWTPPLLYSLLPQIGIGLLAAGILTMTLEPIARKRLQQDVDEIRGAHYESLLKGFMPEPIFKEVQAQIIRQPLLRKNFRVTIGLSWTDDSYDYLWKTQTITYRVVNIGQTKQEYEVSTWEGQLKREGQLTEDKFPNEKKIDLVKVQRSDKLQAEVYTDKELEERKWVRKTDRYVWAQVPVLLEPGEVVEITTNAVSILASSDTYSFNSTGLAIGLEMIIAHPNNLIVECIALHPSDNALKVYVNNATIKNWSITAGLLPYQGLAISWYPKP